MRLLNLALVAALSSGCASPQATIPQAICHNETTYALLDTGAIILENPDSSVAQLVRNPEREGRFLIVPAAHPDRQRVLDRIVALYPDFLREREIRMRDYVPC